MRRTKSYCYSSSRKYERFFLVQKHNIKLLLLLLSSNYTKKAQQTFMKTNQKCVLASYTEEKSMIFPLLPDDETLKMFSKTSSTFHGITSNIFIIYYIHTIAV